MTVPENPNSLREPIGYICPKCDKETGGEYRPFCGDCGRAMPSRKRMQVVGLTTYPNSYKKPIRDEDAIRAVLQSAGKTWFWLDGYRPTFRTAEIRFHDGVEEREPRALICVSTESLCLPIGDRGWCGLLQFDRDPAGGFRLSDEANGVNVRAGSILLYRVDRLMRSW
ncbi:MAG TPA: hypothetical protein VGE52_03805 [Pirellulales bacterium]